MTSTNLGQFVLDKTNTFGDKPAFILKQKDGTRRALTYREFNSIVQKLTTWLRHQFPAKGFKVGLLGENRVEWCALALASWNSGGTIVPLSHISTDIEVQNVCDAAKLDALFMSSKLGKPAPGGCARVFEMDFGRSSEGGKTVGDLIDDPVIKRPPTSFVQVRPNDLAVLIFTSGTTGKPKGVMLTHGNIKTNILDVIGLFPGDTTDRAVSILPLSHMFELTAGFLTCHMKGLCISYPDSLKPEDVLGEMRAHKATFLVAVPLFFEIIDRAITDKLQQLPKGLQNLLEVGRAISTEFPSFGRVLFKKVHAVLGGHMRYFFTGGARVSPEVVQRFMSYGIEMYQGYGLTETSPILTCTHPRANKIGSVGKTVHSVKVRIDFPDEKGEGEIVASGPNIFLGYFGDKESTDAVLREGWFHTGDVGKFDESGFLFITGRKKDIIVTPNGKNVYPDEIESALKESPLFTEVSVIGVDSPRGESVHAVVVASAKVPTGVQEKTIVWREVERLSEALADYKRPSGVTVLRTELPKTSTRKVRKHVLKEMVVSGRAQQESSPGAEKTILEEVGEKEKWLADKLRTISKRDEIWYEAGLRQDLGIDSLTFMEIISGIETQWGIRIPDEEFHNIEKVSDVLLRMGTTTAKAGAGPQAAASARGESSTATAEFDFRKNNTWWMNGLRICFHLLVLRPLFKFVFHLRVANENILEDNDNVVLTPNHSSHLDFPAVVASIPLHKVNRTYAVAAADYFFNTPLKAFAVRLFFNCIPFDRKLRVERGFRICEKILEDGGNLLIFPEGTRSLSGELNTFKPGVGRLLAAKEYRALPIYLVGAYDAFPKGSRIPRPSPIEVRVGSPTKFPDVEGSLSGYREVAQRLEISVRAMEKAHKHGSGRSLP